jgi:hypothetical protein
VPAAYWYQEKDDSNWLMFAVFGIDGQEKNTAMPMAEALPFSEIFSFSLQQKIAESGIDENNVSVLLCNWQGSDYELIEQALADFPVKRIFYLEGGFKAYREFGQNLITQWQSAGNNRRVSGGTADCPKNQGEEK